MIHDFTGYPIHWAWWKQCMLDSYLTQDSARCWRQIQVTPIASNWIMWPSRKVDQGIQYTKTPSHVYHFRECISKSVSFPSILFRDLWSGISKLTPTAKAWWQGLCTLRWEENEKVSTCCHTVTRYYYIVGLSMEQSFISISLHWFPCQYLSSLSVVIVNLYSAPKHPWESHAHGACWDSLFAKWQTKANTDRGRQKEREKNNFQTNQGYQTTPYNWQLHLPQFWAEKVKKNV